MKINEVELAVGITKKNIRFYEAAGLLSPVRSANGYRDYSPEDVEILKRIKLLRRLDIPLEEIRRLQPGSLTLEDSLKRHLVILERRADNLETVIAFCKKILAEDTALDSPAVDKLLEEMDNMEKGGTKFVNIQSKDKRAQKRWALIGALFVIAFPALFLAMAVWAAFTEPIPIAVAVIFLTAPLLVIVSVLYVLKERFREIEGGEIYEASKY